ncbi:MAG: hypothetical protein ACLFN8_01355 [Candidatus Woesearchaeota archaeon]
MGFVVGDVYRVSAPLGPLVKYLLSDKSGVLVRSGFVGLLGEVEGSNAVAAQSYLSGGVLNIYDYKKCCGDEYGVVFDAIDSFIEGRDFSFKGLAVDRDVFFKSKDVHFLAGYLSRFGEFFRKPVSLEDSLSHLKCRVFEFKSFKVAKCVFESYVV